MEGTKKYNNHYKNVNREDGIVRLSFDGNYITKKRIRDKSKQQQKVIPLPFNKNNVRITKEEVENILNQHGLDNYKVKNVKEFERMGIQKSYTRNNFQINEYNALKPIKKYNYHGDDLIAQFIPNMIDEGYVDEDYDFNELLPLQNESNERLEYLGDSCIGSSVGFYLFTRYPKADEGFLTRLRTKIVCGSSLANLAKKIGIDKYLAISRYVEESCEGRENIRFLEDIFEAFFGALRLDSDYDTCQRVMFNILEKYVDFADLIANDKNYKDQLLRYYQQNYDGAFPIYKEVTTEGPTNKRIFEMRVLSPDQTKTVGTGRDKKKQEAEQKASKEALIHYGVINRD